MAIMTRLLRLCKADVHGVMDQLEDKGLLLRQHLREMQSGLDRKERQLAALTQQLDRQTVLVGSCIEEMDKLEQDLNLAIEKEKDDIARVLIRRRRTLETTCKQAKVQMETLSQEKAQLLENLTQQRLAYESLKTKIDAYCRREPSNTPANEPCHFLEGVHPPGPSEEEIELELLRRKQAQQKGDTP
jgi:phage shock protein A